MIINAVGKVKVKILDNAGTVLAESEEFTGDSTNAELNFKGFAIKALNEKVFRLEFEVSGELYSFGFLDKDGKSGGATAAGIVD